MARIRILAVASAGGHWVQLQRLRPAWDGLDVAYMTTSPSRRAAVFADAEKRGQPVPRFHLVVDANRWQKWRLVKQLLQITWVVIKERPTVILSTGASLGFFTLAIGKLLRARTVWIDSIANAEELSLSGRRVGPFADLWLTQWPEVAGSVDPDKGLPAYRGSVV